MRYTATACQIALQSCFDARGDFDAARLEQNFERTERSLRAIVDETGSRLLVLPEFSFHGWAPGISLAAWNAASVSIPGPETDRIARIARLTGAYIACTLFERLPAFPGRHFLTGLIIAPDGAVVLRYHKQYAFSAKTRPGDVYERYVDLYGREALFPVAETPLGRLGLMIAWDAQFPEVARALAMRGAELILHPLGSARTAADVGRAFAELRRVRAYENLVWLVSANMGPLDSTRDAAQGRWPSQIIDFEGRVVAESASEGESSASATIDLEALRSHRAQPLRNWLAQLQPQLHAPDYAAARLWPLSHWAARPIADGREFFELESTVAQRIAAEPAIGAARAWAAAPGAVAHGERE